MHSAILSPHVDTSKAHPAHEITSSTGDLPRAFTQLLLTCTAARCIARCRPLTQELEPHVVPRESLKSTGPVLLSLCLTLLCSSLFPRIPIMDGGRERRTAPMSWSTSGEYLPPPPTPSSSSPYSVFPLPTPTLLLDGAEMPSERQTGSVITNSQLFQFNLQTRSPVLRFRDEAAGVAAQSVDFEARRATQAGHSGLLIRVLLFARLCLRGPLFSIHRGSRTCKPRLLWTRDSERPALHSRWTKRCAHDILGAPFRYVPAFNGLSVGMLCGERPRRGLTCTHPAAVRFLLDHLDLSCVCLTKRTVAYCHAWISQLSSEAEIRCSSQSDPSPNLLSVRMR